MSSSSQRITRRRLFHSPVFIFSLFLQSCVVPRLQRWRWWFQSANLVVAWCFAHATPLAHSASVVECSLVAQLPEWMMRLRAVWCVQPHLAAARCVPGDPRPHSIYVSWSTAWCCFLRYARRSMPPLLPSGTPDSILTLTRKTNISLCPCHTVGSSSTTPF